MRISEEVNPNAFLSELSLRSLQTTSRISRSITINSTKHAMTEETAAAFEIFLIVCP